MTHQLEVGVGQRRVACTSVPQPPLCDSTGMRIKASAAWAGCSLGSHSSLCILGRVRRGVCSSRCEHCSRREPRDQTYSSLGACEHLHAMSALCDAGGPTTASATSLGGLAEAATARAGEQIWTSVQI
jgi:hypothetical protein